MCFIRCKIRRQSLSLLDPDIGKFHGTYRTKPIKCQSCPYIETSQLICCANQLTGFYMTATLAFNGLTGSLLHITTVVVWWSINIVWISTKIYDLAIKNCASPKTTTTTKTKLKKRRKETMFVLVFPGGVC